MADSPTSKSSVFTTKSRSSAYSDPEKGEMGETPGQSAEEFVSEILTIHAGTELRKGFWSFFTAPGRKPETNEPESLTQSCEWRHIIQILTRLWLTCILSQWTGAPKATPAWLLSWPATGASCNTAGSARCTLAYC